MGKDYYILLGISRGAAPHKIKQAYRRIAKQLHPDLSRSPTDAEKFIEAKEAYETLAGEERRRAYDDDLRRVGSPLRILRVPEVVRDRRAAYRRFERQRSFADEFFEGILPGFYTPRRYASPEKDI
jgi:DnaJ-class molecular chaperone